MIKTLPEHCPLATTQQHSMGHMARCRWEVCKGPGCRKLFTFTEPVKAWTNTSPGSIETLTALFDDVSDTTGEDVDTTPSTTDNLPSPWS